MLKISIPGAERLTHTKVAVGDKAPDFVLPEQTNRSVHFAVVLGKGPVVLFFYPRDYSAGCTAQVCAFRDSYEAFKDAGATVIGVSADSTESHEGFSQRYRLPYILLSDKESVAQKLYGVDKIFGIVRSRITFVIDSLGLVHHIFSSQFNINEHIDDALQVIRSLQAEAANDLATSANSEPTR
jgi:peroxiredoxin Q/BCP